MLVHPNSWNTRCIAQLGLTTILGEVANFPTVVARVTDRCKLLWWPDCHLLLDMVLKVYDLVRALVQHLVSGV
jgi:hypothetical protein